jgi:hypothetical protein
MFGISRLYFRAQRPGIKKKVIEFKVGGWIGKKMSDRNWAGTTLAFPFIVFILYWTGPKIPEVKPLIRVHEMEHVAQDQAESLTIIWWFKYIVQSIKNGYKGNRFEVWAYLVAQSWSDRRNLPEWAK